MSAQIFDSESEWVHSTIDETCIIEYGTRVTRKRDAGTIYPVYGGGGATFQMDSYNRKNRMVVSRFAMSETCTRFVEGKFFLNDSGLTLRPKNENQLLSIFLDWLIHSLNDEIYSLGRGTAQKNLNMEEFRKLSIQYPKDISEQQRIISILDEAFNKLAISSVQLNQKILNASEIYQTSLSSIFAKNQNWESGCLGDVTGGVQTGPFGSLLHKSDYIANGIPIVNPAHITETGIVADENKTISVETAHRLSNYLLKPQYVVIGRRGEMGRCAVVNEKEDGWLCGTGSFFIKPSEQIDSHFLVKLLWSERYRKKLNEIATGATMKNLNNKALTNLVVEFPSITEQKQILSRLDNLFSEIEMLKQTFSLKSESLDELKQSILREAFNGTL